jgi:uncharacterized protein YjiK
MAVERQPGLVLAISPELDEIRKAIALKAQVGFVSPHADDEDLDDSGLAWSRRTRTLWLVSDTGRRIFLLDPKPDHARAIDLTYRHKDETKTIKNAEGIALDEGNDRLYVLTDDGKDSRMFVFDLSSVPGD